MYISRAKELVENLWFSVTEHGHGKGVKPKIRGRKLRSGAYWYGALEQKGVKRWLSAPGILCCGVFCGITDTKI